MLLGIGRGYNERLATKVSFVTDAAPKPTCDLGKRECKRSIATIFLLVRLLVFILYVGVFDPTFQPESPKQVIEDAVEILTFHFKQTKFLNLPVKLKQGQVSGVCLFLLDLFGIKVLFFKKQKQKP